MKKLSYYYLSEYLWLEIKFLVCIYTLTQKALYLNKRMKVKIICSGKHDLSRYSDDKNSNIEDACEDFE